MLFPISTCILITLCTTTNAIQGLAYDGDSRPNIVSIREGTS